MTRIEQIITDLVSNKSATTRTIRVIRIPYKNVVYYHPARLDLQIGTGAAGVENPARPNLAV